MGQAKPIKGRWQRFQCHFETGVVSIIPQIIYIKRTKSMNYAANSAAAFFGLLALCWLSLADYGLRCSALEK